MLTMLQFNIKLETEATFEINAKSHDLNIKFCIKLSSRSEKFRNRS